MFGRLGALSLLRWMNITLDPAEPVRQLYHFVAGPAPHVTRRAKHREEYLTPHCGWSPGAPLTIPSLIDKRLEFYYASRGAKIS